MSKREELHSWLKASVIVADGAMGTVLRARGIGAAACLEEANLTQSELIFALHREYLHAGARILTTNTFKANRLHLAAFDLARKIRDINARGVTIIMIEHIMRAIMRFSTHVMCLDAGNIIAMGAPEAIVNDEAVRKIYLGA